MRLAYTLLSLAYLTLSAVAAPAVQTTVADIDARLNPFSIDQGNLYIVTRAAFTGVLTPLGAWRAFTGALPTTTADSKGLVTTIANNGPLLVNDANHFFTRFEALPIKLVLSDLRAIGPAVLPIVGRAEFTVALKQLQNSVEEPLTAFIKQTSEAGRPQWETYKSGLDQEILLTLNVSGISG